MVRASMSVLAAIVLVAVGCSSGPEQAEPSTTGGTDGAVEPAGELLGPAEFARYMEDNPDVPVVNVHIPYEGHIEGTDSFVAFDEIADWVDLPDDRAAPLVLYCRSGNMSGEAAETLESMGYTGVVDLRGGMNAWTEAGFELLTEEPATD